MCEEGKKDNKGGIKETEEGKVDKKGVILR